MNVPVLLTLLAVPVAGGTAATWIWARKRDRGVLASRLAKLTSVKSAPPPLVLIKQQDASNLPPAKKLVLDLPALDALKNLLLQADLERYLFSAVLATVLLLLAPICLAPILGLDPLLCGVIGIVLCVVPIILVWSRAEARRTKFCEQLPDAIDLMVAVLRSGHSVSQAVKAVSDESPAPCGQEFEAVLHRMNLGQPLAESLVLSSKRFRSYELDLMRRAIKIQNEVGGSLADLLDKTNGTLRQRLKLARQVKVITSQSRLSAQIVGFLPVVLAIGLNTLSPGYLQSLYEDPLGRCMMCVAVFLQMFGLYVMNRMSTMKV